MQSYRISTGGWKGVSIWRRVFLKVAYSSKRKVRVAFVVIALVAIVAIVLAICLGGPPGWFVSRGDWKALKPLDTPSCKGLVPFPDKIKRVIIAHTTLNHCFNIDDCKMEVKVLQEIAMFFHYLDDIWYNFVIGGDGRVYEGRGWNYIGQHTSTFNQDSLGIAFMGNYHSSMTNDQPTADQIKNLHRLLDIGLENLSLTQNYTIIGQCQVKNTLSPGDNLYKEIITWDRYGPDDQSRCQYVN